MPQKPSVTTYLETLMRQTHKAEAEVQTLGLPDWPATVVARTYFKAAIYVGRYRVRRRWTP